MDRMELEHEDEVERLRSLMQSFFRDFGLLAANETPCGHPIPVSYAHALMVLLERRRERAPTSQANLGEALGIDKSNIARLCRRMEDAGHATQTRDPADGRGRLVELTDAGVTIARQIERASRARFRKIMTLIAPRRRSAVLESLANLNEAVTALRGTKDES
jgi:DNA-binding MarR family transcriptional regulator